MSSTWRKWKAVASIYAQDGLAYRASGIIWVLTDLVTALTMPFVWQAASKSGPIQGMNGGDLTAYYLATLIIGAFVTSHLMWELAFEIKEGRFTVQLVRPFSIYQFTFLRNITWRIIRLGLTAPFLIFLLWLYRDALSQANFSLSWQFFASVLLGHLVSFTFVMAMASLALIVTEVFSIFQLYYVPQLFLSGYLFPMALFPDWVQSLSRFLPFYYTLGAPTEILLQRVPESNVPAVLLTQLAWIGVFYVAAKFMWKLGLKHYTAVGM